MRIDPTVQAFVDNCNPSYFVGVESDPKSVLRNDIDNAMSDKYLIGMLYLAASDMSGFNVCGAHASSGCIAACLVNAGQGAIIRKTEKISRVNVARIKRTQLFFMHRQDTLTRIIREITNLENRAKKRGLRAAVRLNGMSDLPWENIIDINSMQTIFELFPNVQFYDYTPNFSRMSAFCSGLMPKNYWLTFSRKETRINNMQCLAVLAAGGNVAVPFIGESFPNSFYGRSVIDGTGSDLRFHDGKSKVVALCAKGKKAKKDTSGFIVR